MSRKGNFQEQNQANTTLPPVSGLTQNKHFIFIANAKRQIWIWDPLQIFVSSDEKVNLFKTILEVLLESEQRVQMKLHELQINQTTKYQICSPIYVTHKRKCITITLSIPIITNFTIIIIIMAININISLFTFMTGLSVITSSRAFAPKISIFQ